jgi:hypothetical protein
LLTLGTWGILGKWWLSGQSTQKNHDPWSNLHITTALILWTLLVAYHRAYDTLLVILFFALVGFGLVTPGSWKLTNFQRTFLIAILAAAGIVMVPPARGISLVVTLLPNPILASWLDLQGQGMTIMLIMMLVCTLWLIFKTDVQTA